MQLSQSYVLLLSSVLQILVEGNDCVLVHIVLLAIYWRLLCAGDIHEHRQSELPAVISICQYHSLSTQVTH